MHIFLTSVLYLFQSINTSKAAFSLLIHLLNSFFNNQLIVWFIKCQNSGKYSFLESKVTSSKVLFCPYKTERHKRKVANREPTKVSGSFTVDGLINKLFQL